MYTSPRRISDISKTLTNFLSMHGTNNYWWRNMSSCLLSNSSTLPSIPSPSTSQCQPALYHVPSSLSLPLRANPTSLTPLSKVIHCPISSYAGTHLVAYKRSIAHLMCVGPSITASFLPRSCSFFDLLFLQREKEEMVCCGFRERALGHCCSD